MLRLNANGIMENKVNFQETMVSKLLCGRTAGDIPYHGELAQGPKLHKIRPRTWKMCRQFGFFANYFVTTLCCTMYWGKLK